MALVGVVRRVCPGSACGPARGARGAVQVCRMGFVVSVKRVTRRMLVDVDLVWPLSGSMVVVDLMILDEDRVHVLKWNEVSPNY